MSRKEIPFSSQDGARSQLSSVWNCSCNSTPIRDILISRQGVVGVAADSNIYLYAGAPSFGSSHTLSLSPARLIAYGFLADGTHFLTGDSQGLVKWWDVHNGEESTVTRFPYEKPMQDVADELPPISSIACSKESNLVAVTAGNTLCVYGDGGKRLYSVGPFDSAIQSIEWKNADELAVNIGNGICMIHAGTEEYHLRQKYPNELKDGSLKILACSPKGNMFAAGCTTGLVQIWDLASESNEQISVLMKGLPNAAADDASVQCLEWDASGRFIAAAGGSDVIAWDMQDTSEKEEGKDNSIVCYGHGQKAKITALCFQPKGPLLATGGDDCQVLVFDSTAFTSNGVVGGLVESLVSGKLSQSKPGAAITTLAWHPSGLILAGTTDGYVDAFEVSGAIHETPRATNGNTTDVPFLITKANPGRRAPPQKPNGWGGEPLAPARRDNGGGDKGFARRRSGASGNMGGGPRSVGNRPRVYMGPQKQPYQRPTNSTENTGNGATPNWPPMMPPPQGHPHPMMRWPGMPPQQVPPPYPPQPTAVAPPPPMHPDASANPPQTPESVFSSQPTRSESKRIAGNSSEGAIRALPPTAPVQQQHRNDRTQNRNGYMDQAPPLMPGAPMPYPTGMMPYPSPFPMGYPMAPYCYPCQMHPHAPTEGMHAVIPGYGAPPFGRPPINPPPKAHMQRDASVKAEITQKDGSTELEEELGSKSSEATNNGVNNSATPSQHSETTSFYHDGRQNLGQTLYVGNLAPAVEDGLLMQLFSSYGPIMGVQVIRERETRMSRGFGFVTFAHPYCAQLAMDQLDSVQIQGPFEGRKLKVSFSNRR